MPTPDRNKEDQGRPSQSPQEREMPAGKPQPDRERRRSEDETNPERTNRPDQREQREPGQRESNQPQREGERTERGR